ncbi:MAG: hypothetical protein GY765_32995 [bacterium]|nr:hypothetical protein [bacterium]
MKIKVSSSFKALAAKLSKLLFQYPYGCMEQRTSKVLPLPALRNRLRDSFIADWSEEKIEKAVNFYLREAPEFMAPGGGMAYYKGGEPSRYLTIYVMWAFTLAEKEGFDVDREMIMKMESYLQTVTLNTGQKCFLQYVLSARQKADTVALTGLYKQKDHMSLMGKIFLYQSIHRQLKDKNKTHTLLEQLEKHLRFHGNEAFLKKETSEYSRDLPFYGNRYVTALFLQALLEVEGSHPYVPKLLKWLLNVPSYQWRTTQSNFWILAALSRAMEEKRTQSVEVTVAGRKMKKTFSSKDNEFLYEVPLFCEGAAALFPPGSPENLSINIRSSQNVVAAIELEYTIENPSPYVHGVIVKRHIYKRDGSDADVFKRGEIYQVELLVDADADIPYGVIESPIPAGFQLLRKDLASGRVVKPFNTDYAKNYKESLLHLEHESARTVYYSYKLKSATRVVYFVKALYTGTFTWLPAKVEGMYTPQIWGHSGTQIISIKEY